MNSVLTDLYICLYIYLLFKAFGSDFEDACFWPEISFARAVALPAWRNQHPPLRIDVLARLHKLFKAQENLSSSSELIGP